MTENEGEEDDELITWEDLVKCNSFLNNFSCFGKEHLINFCKVEYVFPMAIWPEFRVGKCTVHCVLRVATMTIRKTHPTLE